MRILLLVGFLALSGCDRLAKELKQPGYGDFPEYRVEPCFVTSTQGYVHQGSCLIDPRYNVVISHQPSGFCWR
jgi:hypothetical protein